MSDSPRAKAMIMHRMTRARDSASAADTIAGDWSLLYPVMSECTYLRLCQKGEKQVLAHRGQAFESTPRTAALIRSAGTERGSEVRPSLPQTFPSMQHSQGRAGSSGRGPGRFLVM